MKSYWLEEYKYEHKNPPMESTVDILIVGAGMTGLMTAYELSKNNKDIVVVEANKLVHGVSSKTTAKLTTMHNQLYQDIMSYHGFKKAKLYYEAGKEALEYLTNIIEKENIACDLESIDNYIYAKTEKGEKKLLKEYSVLRRMGVDIELVDNPNYKKTLRLKNQYMFHPIKYLMGIIKILKQRNVLIYENHNVVKIKKEDNHYLVKFSNNKEIRANKIIIATHYPFKNPGGLYYSKLYQEKNYLIAFKTKNKIDGMYINSELPVRSLRPHGENIGIMVGSSHKAGTKVNYKKRMKKLRESVYEFDKDAVIINEWTNQDVMSIDSLPFIGKYSRCYPNMYVATAFHTWGMTNSHVAAILLSKEIMGKKSRYKELFNPLRISHIRSPIESLKIIGKAINGLIISRIGIPKKQLKDIKDNDGGIIKYKGNHYAVYKGKEYIFLKPTCTHTYCSLVWNKVEKTFDCKCHGSRFDVYGKVVIGPAIKPLERVKFNKK